MTKSGKAVSKLSGIMSEHEAQRTLTSLRDKSLPPEETGHVLCENFTAAVRREILVHLADLLREGKEPLAGDILARFLRTQWAGVLPANAESHAGSILRVAIAVLPKSGPGTAASVLLELLRTNQKAASSESPPYLDSEELRNLAANNLALSAVVAPILELAAARKLASPIFLRRWQRLLVPLLGANSGGKGFGQQEAVAILRAFGTMDSAVIPDDVALICPRILSLAPPSEAKAFIESDLGRVVGRLHSSIAPRSALTPDEQARGGGDLLQKVPSQRAAPIRPPEEELKEVLDKLLTSHRETLANVRKELEEKNSHLAGAMSDLRELSTDLDKIKRLYATDVEPLREELRYVKEELLSTKASLSKAEADLSQWQREAGFKEHETASRLKLQTDAQQEKLSVTLSRPTRNLRDHVESLIKSHPGNREVQHVAVAFDALHMKLLRILNEPIEARIPRELLPGNEQ